VQTESEKAEAISGLPEELRGRRRLVADERFCFGCHRELACFTRCCADVNIFLTPVDVLRLARRNGITTTEFLERFALKPITKDLHLPVILLRMGDDSQRRCPFVSDLGCAVYEDRPWSCRMYPVGMAIPPARAGVAPQPVYFLFEDDFCAGHGSPREWTVDAWREDQAVVEREHLESGFREIVSHPWFIGGRQLDPKRIEMFHMAAYDLDSFRRFVFESSFTRRFVTEPSLLETVRGNDDELLRFGFQWLRYALFGEPTMTVRPGAATRSNGRTS
jgi:Fe-S-cluster containining protein